MGYCDEHDRVFRGAECPDCAGDQTHADDPSAGGATNQRSDREEPDVDFEGNIEQTVTERIRDAAEGLDTESEDGDIVIGEQHKNVDKTEHVDIDNSTEIHDEVTEAHDSSTELTDNVVKDSTIGTDEAGADDESDETVYCIHCGEEITTGSDNCPVCGGELT